MDYSVKSGKTVYSYKLDETQKLLHLTVKNKDKIVRCTDADLSNAFSGFLEDTPKEQERLSLFFDIAFLFIGIIILVGYVWFLIAMGKMFSLYALGLWLPCGLMVDGIACIRDFAYDKQGYFYFNSLDDSDEFEIVYTPETRQDALEFAKQVNEFCGKKINHSASLAEHKFENYTVKLFENQIVMYNAKGSAVDMIDFKDIKENVEFQDNKYTVNNIIFGTLAGICFLAALGLFIFSIAMPIYLAMQTQFHWNLLLAGVACIALGCLPLAIGKYFFGFCHRREIFYFISAKDEDCWTNNFALTIGKDTADASDFIKTLEKLIRSAHRKPQEEK